MFLRVGADRKQAADALVEGQVDAAIVLYREAALLYLAAFVTAGAEPALPDSPKPDEVLGAFGAAAGERGSPLDRQQTMDLDELMAPTALLDVARLAAEEAAARGERARRLVSRLSGLVDPRTVEEVRFERKLRAGALLVIALVAATAVIARAIAHRNLALHRPVRISDNHARTASAPEGLTDGLKVGAYGAHTSVSNDPWIDVDLEAIYAVDQVKVYNRGDTNFNDGLPMTLQFSDDGQRFVDVETRTQPFSQQAPWIASTGGRKARFVRIHAKPGKYIALTELEVFGRRR